MLLNLRINGELKMTAEVDIENLTQGQRRKRLCELLNVPSDLPSLTRFNFFNPGPKFFDVKIPEDKVPPTWHLDKEL